jgi:CheY-like chemotaxis protein
VVSEAKLQPILLVEDDAADAKLLIRKFHRVGVQNEIIHLDHGDRALAYLTGVAEYSDRARYPLPILIILDLKLPGMAGLELLPVIRRNREVKAIPVVILTGQEDERVMRGAYELGANSYLVKSAEESKILALAEGIRDYWLHLNRTPSLSIKKTVM